jgi:1,5-anhydro-D-fructose reductase (1,5-anhydro-D-mannitol-forming)
MVASEVVASGIRWGILGCGNVCERKSGPAFQRANGSSLVAVMRRDLGKAREFAARHGVPRAYDDASALLADAEVDAVYIATPPSSHAQLAIACAEAGKPAYVEKPMARSLSECRAMVDAFALAKKPLFVAYYRRALPRFLAIKRLVDEGAIGVPQIVEAQILRRVDAAERDPETWPWRVRPEIAGGGHFVDLACHTLDLLDFILGPLGDVAGIAQNRAGLYPAEDTVTLTGRFASGAQLSASYCFCANERRDRCEIIGDAGSVRFATFADEPIRLTDASGVRELSIAHPEAIQLPLVQTIVDQLLGRGGQCPSTGETALRTTWVMEQVLARYVAAKSTTAALP